MKYEIQYTVTEKHLAHRSCVIEADNEEAATEIFYENTWDCDEDSELLDASYLETEDDFEITSVTEWTI